MAITPASGYVGAMGSLAIGLGAGIFCHYAVHFEILRKIGLDDSLEVFGVHGIGGIWGALATGVFAMSGGLVTGEANILLANIVAVLVTNRLLRRCLVRHPIRPGQDPRPRLADPGG